MLNVKTPAEALKIINENFGMLSAVESLKLSEVCGRILSENIVSTEYVPDFNRSTVDGYAVFARDTFGSSDSNPAVLLLDGEIKMGEASSRSLEKGTCVAVATGSDIPDCADAVVMVEHTENYGDGTIGIAESVAPGENIIFRGDDIVPGKVLLPAGHVVEPHDIGALAAMGISTVKVSAKPRFGIISTGDELVEFDEVPLKGQVRDVNSQLLEALIQNAGAQTKSYGIIQDSEDALLNSLAVAVTECQAIIISGGSSVGMKDATARTIEKLGRLLLHGVAMKPGKPTILGSIDGKPVFGLPGHPVAAYFTAQLFITPLIFNMIGRRDKKFCLTARLSETMPSNHGRTEYIGVVLDNRGDVLTAHPIHSKSGLITGLCGSDGYICIPRDCEGLPKDAIVSVMLWSR